MNKTMTIIAIGLFALLISLAGCQTKQVSPGSTEPVFNQTLNDALEGQTQPEVPGFVEFTFQYKTRNESKYEIVETDIFTLLNESINASEISVFGVMLGDSYETVLAYMGIPDVMFTPADNSYRNMEYGKKIGIGAKQTAITFHLENDTVTSINMRPTFAKYLHGNTSIKTPKETYYELMSVPDYTDFTSYHRVLHYVENGVHIYLYRDNLDILSLTQPRVFKGVKWVTERYEAGPGIYFNQTKAVLID